MKKIAITQRVDLISGYQELREGLDTNWCKLLTQVGAIPLVIPSYCELYNYLNTMEIDGAILSGGNDLSIVSQSSSCVRRDELEEELISYCIENKLPILGVCRGMQVIANYFSCELKVINDHIGVEHDLIANNASKYYQQLSLIRSVNSYHKFGISELSSELISAATSPDGEIEAIEHPNLKIFGQMWHSERNIPFSKNELELIKLHFSL